MLLSSCFALLAACSLRASQDVALPCLSTWGTELSCPTAHGLCDLCPFHWCCSSVEIPSEGLNSPCSPPNYIDGRCFGFLRAEATPFPRPVGVTSLFGVAVMLVWRGLFSARQGHLGGCVVWSRSVGLACPQAYLCPPGYEGMGGAPMMELRTLCRAGQARSLG